jgi:hypothetical protein
MMTENGDGGLVPEDILLLWILEEMSIADGGPSL